MGAAHAAGSARRPGQRRCAAVNGELCFVVQDHEHLLHLVVIVMSDAGLGWQYAAVKKEQISVKGRRVEKLLEQHLACSLMHMRLAAVFGGISMRNTPRQRLPRDQGVCE